MLKLPFWLNGPELEKLRLAAAGWWSRMETWARWPLGQLDPLTCRPALLELLAYQRRVVRFKGESLELYRLRVKLALVNAKDSGQKAGFTRIFERLGITLLAQSERVDPIDWDVILLEVDDSTLTGNAEILDFIIAEYGRTCRRYRLAARSVPDPIGMGVAHTGHSYDYDAARL